MSTAGMNPPVPPCDFETISKFRRHMRTIALKEPFGRNWKRELLFFPMEFKTSERRVGRVSIESPGGELPAQLTDVICWPGTEYVKSAKLAAILDIEPFSSVEYQIRFSPRPGSSSVSAGDLRIAVSDNDIRIENTHVSVSFPNVQAKFESPLPSGQVPGPVKAMSVGDGPLFGSSRLQGPRKIRRCQTRLLEQGPIFASIRITYEYQGGEILELTFQLAAGDSRLFVYERWTGDSLDDRWELYLKPGFDRLCLDQLPWEHGTNSWGAEQGGAADVNLEDQPPGNITNLVPWNDWWDDRTQTSWALKTPALGKCLSIASCLPGEWVEPAPAGTLCPWDGWRRKMIPICRGENGDIYLHMNAANGRRCWNIGGIEAGVGREFQNIKEMIFCWKESKRHPRLFLSAQELAALRRKYTAGHGRVRKLIDLGSEETFGKPHIADSKATAAYLLTGDPKVAEKLQLVGRLRKYLDCMGAFDKMRFLAQAVVLYDALIDSGLIDAQESGVMRAKMVFLAYHLADPSNWSVERGYRSYNLNMSVNHLLNLGRIACVLKEHPMAETWFRPAAAMMEDMLAQVGPEGEWPESVSNYVHVTASAMLSFAVMAKSAGFADYVNDTRMKKLCSFMAKQYAPCGIRNPKDGRRALPPHGRSQAGHRWALAGIMARATRKTDPRYSAEQQWCWLKTGPSYDVEQFGGWEEAYTDTGLPAAHPSWESEAFPQAGVIFRHGFGTKDEFYANIVSADFNHQVFPSETGCVSMFHAMGSPLAGSFFGGYSEREECLTSRVSLARKDNSPERRRSCFGYTGTEITPQEEMSGKRLKKKMARFGKNPGISNIGVFSHLPRLDYAEIDVAMVHRQPVCSKLAENLPEWPSVPGEGRPPLHWRRQAMMVKGETASQPAYLILRDTVKGGQPTIWSMWTLSDFLDTPEETLKIRKCENSRSIRPAREIFGDRFTAVGQHGVDIEYFVASPADTSRHTLRWGTTYKPERCVWHHVSTLDDDYPDYRDLLHLQLPGDGAYFVAMFPRKRGSAAPSFKSLCDGKVIMAQGAFGTDYSFLNHEKSKASGEVFSFEGTAAAIQNRSDGLTLSLAAVGRVSFGEFALSSKFPAEAHFLPRKRKIVLHKSKENQIVTLKAPDKWRLLDLTGVDK